MNYFKRNRVEVIEKILKGGRRVEQGLSISNSQAERILDRLGSEMNDHSDIRITWEISCGRFRTNSH